MANAEFVIRDQFGNISLNFADRITRLTLSLDYLVGTPDNSVYTNGYTPTLIRICDIADMDTYWFVVRFDKTVDPAKSVSEIGPSASWEFSMVTRALIESFGSFMWNSAFLWTKEPPLMDYNSAYIMIRDLRDPRATWQAGYTYNRITLEVGRY